MGKQSKNNFDALSWVTIICGCICIAINYINPFNWLPDDQKLTIAETALFTIILLYTTKLLLDYSKLNNLIKQIVNKEITDDFFKNRAFLESNYPMTKLAELKPTKLFYSGGHLASIIENESFKDYITNNKVEVRFIFPDPTIESVITDFVKNITADEDTEEYKGKINNSVKTLQSLIDKKCKATIKYKFCKFAPSFGLQIIKSSAKKIVDVDIYTIGIKNKYRDHIFLEKNKAPNKYDRYIKQFETLWSKSP